jgi:hypothetical protein
MSAFAVAHYTFPHPPLPAMSVTQYRVQNIFATNEKSDDLEELGLKKSPDFLPSLESDPPNGGFQAWATVFGWYAVSRINTAGCSPQLHNT